MDFERDATKKRLRKLVLNVEAKQGTADSWAEGAARLSGNRTKDAMLLGKALVEALNEASSSGGGGGGGGEAGAGSSTLVFECRGEQAACRALKAALGVQNLRQQWLLLAPAWGAVADVVAEKRGEERSAEGLLLAVGVAGAAGEAPSSPAGGSTAGEAPSSPAGGSTADAS